MWCTIHTQVGSIFAALPDTASKRAFYATAKAIHDAPAVRSQLTKCAITPELLRTSSSTYSTLMTVPDGACITQLVGCGFVLLFVQICRSDAACSMARSNGLAA
mgnify:CR=1 FL=1